MSLHHSIAQWAAWFWPLLTNHVWEATLTAAAAWVAAGLVGKSSTRARSLVWTAAMAKFILPSIVLIWPVTQWIDLSAARARRTRPETTVQATTDQPAVARLSSAVKSGVETTGLIARPLPAPIDRSQTGVEKRHNEICCALTIVWLGGVIWGLSSWLLTRRRFRRRIKSARDVTEGREREMLDRLQLQAGVARKIRLAESDEIVDPGLWGVLRPTIVTPKGLMERLDDRELETLLLHELVHARSHDNLIGSLQRILCGVFWFHPLVWRMDRWKREETEIRCDRRVIELGGDPAAYLQCIGKVLQFGMGRSLAGVSQTAGSNLRRRIEFMKTTRGREVRTRPWAATAVVLGGFFTLMLTLAFAPITDTGARTRESDLPDVFVWNAGTVEPPPANWEQLLSAAPEYKMQAENSERTPVRVNGAGIRCLKLDGYAACLTSLSLETGSRPVHTAWVESLNLRTNSAIKYRVSLIHPEPGQFNTIRNVWFLEGENLPFLDEPANQLAIKITHVQYVDERLHEKLLRKLQRTPSYKIPIAKGSPMAAEAEQLAPAFPMRVKTPPNAPAVLEQGLIRIAELWEVREKNVRVAQQFKLRLKNPAGRPMTGCIVKLEHANLTPPGLHVFRIPREKLQASESDDASPTFVSPVTVIGGATKLDKAALDYTVTLVGAEYEDGSFWFAAEDPSKILDLTGKPGMFGVQAGDPDPQPPPPPLMDRAALTSPAYFIGGMHPTYTEEARAKRISGMVVLEGVILADGTLAEIQVREGLPYGLTEQAIGAAKRAHFRAARVKDREVSVRTTIAYQFSSD